MKCVKLVFSAVMMLWTASCVHNGPTWVLRASARCVLSLLQMQDEGSKLVCLYMR